MFDGSNWDNLGETKSGNRSPLNSWLNFDYGDSLQAFNLDEAGSSTASKTSHKIPSGSNGMLGTVLGKMHSGIVLSQHDVAAAVRDYNQLNSHVEELEHRINSLKLQVSEDDSAGIKPPGEIGNLTRDERHKLAEQLERKDRLIAEYQKKLKDVTQSSKHQGIVDVKISHIAPPAKIVDNFCDLYENEWMHAYNSLQPTYNDEERTIHTLFRVVKKYKPAIVVSEENQKHIDIGQKLIEDYRNILLSQSIPGIQELFVKVKLPDIFESGFVTKAVRDFVNRVVELLWLMVVQDPPMMVSWLEHKQIVTKQHYNFFKRKGSIVIQTVWPAIFDKVDGAIMSKGVVLAGSTDDVK